VENEPFLIQVAGILFASGSLFSVDEESKVE
jgi:hypothetical protein